MQKHLDPPKVPQYNYRPGYETSSTITWSSESFNIRIILIHYLFSNLDPWDEMETIICTDFDISVQSLKTSAVISSKLVNMCNWVSLSKMQVKNHQKVQFP